MFRNYFKTSIRNLFKDKLFSSLNIAGLAVGMASCLFIFQYIYFERSYDRFNKKIDHIYRVTSKYTGSLSNLDQTATNHPSVGPAMKAEFPEVKDFVRVVNINLFGNATVLTWKSPTGTSASYNEDKIFITDKSFFNIFDYHLIEGDPNSCLSQPLSMVITQSIAKKYFGNTPAMGQTILANGDMPFRITGIVQDVPENSHLKFNVLLSFETLGHNWGYDEWAYGEFYNYVLLEHGADPAQLEKKFPAFIVKHMSKDMKIYNYGAEFRLQPLADIHLKSNLLKEAEVNGNEMEVKFLVIIGLFVLAIAWINFINLSTAKSMERAKEVGMRKVVGAAKYQLLIQFLFDSLLTNIIALLVAGLLILSAIPFVKGFLGKDITSGFFSSGLGGDPWFWICVALIFICGALLVGLYPAFILASFRPAVVLKGLWVKPGQSVSIRKVLVAFQFILSLVLIAGTLIVATQLFYMRNAAQGYNKDRVLVIKVPGVGDSTIGRRHEYFVRAVQKLASVNNICVTSDIPGEMIRYQNVVRRESDASTVNYTTNLLEVDERFIPVYGIQLLAGRNFRSNEKLNVKAAVNQVLVNEMVMYGLGFKTPEEAINQKVVFELGASHVHCEIIGIIRNFHQRSFREPFEPILFYSPGFSDWKYFSVSLRNSESKNTVSAIEQEYKSAFPGNPFNSFFLDDFFDQQYKSDQRLGKVVTLFTVLAIVVSCLGLLGLSGFLVRLRTREVGIRKVLGASVLSVLVLFSRDFIKLIVISSILAVPLIYFAAGRWLKNYAFHIDLSWVYFVLPPLLLLIISMAIVWWQTLKVGLANPIRALRQE